MGYILAGCILIMLVLALFLEKDGIGYIRHIFKKLAGKKLIRVHNRISHKELEYCDKSRVTVYSDQPIPWITRDLTVSKK